MSNIINFPAAPPPLGPPSDTSAAANNAPQSPANPAGTSQNVSQAPQPLNSPTLYDMAHYSFDFILEDVTREYIAYYKTCGGSRNADCVRTDLVTQTQSALSMANLNRPRDARFTIPRSLLPIQIAMIILVCYSICNIVCDEDSQSTILGLYVEDGEDAGTYQTNEIAIRRLIRSFNSTLSKQDLTTTLEILEERAPVMQRCINPNLIPLNNGIFDYTSKQLCPFSPEYIFLRKCPVNYVPTPVSPVIIMPDGVRWTVDTWMNKLSDDPEIVKLLWEVIGAAVRPGVDWGKCIITYDPSGANGKSTYNTLLRALCGRGACANLSIAHFGDKFRLESIIGASLIIYDENPSHTYLDDCADYKAAITHDAINIDRKYRSSVSYTFTGLMVQGTNSLPKMRDTSGSLLRRLLFIPFTKSFLGRARPYIKDDYVKRQDVLEYVLHKVLNMPDYYKFDEPAASKRILAEYEIFNNGVKEFFEEFRDRFVWNFLPFDYLYDLYLAWSKRVNPSGKQLSKSSFKQELRQILKVDPDWMVYTKPDGKDGQVRPGKYITEYEPLTKEYGLLNWQYFHFDLHHAPAQRSSYANIKPHYTGVMRKTPRAVTAPPQASDLTQLFCKNIAFILPSTSK